MKPYELAQSLLLEGRILATTDQRESGSGKSSPHGRLANAVRGMVSQVRQLLRELGNPPVPGVKRGAFGIIHLAAANVKLRDLAYITGLTNPQIAGTTVSCGPSNLTSPNSSVGSMPIAGQGSHQQSKKLES